ncbi:laccase-23-like [Elaeis guineensis]|uniref:laccase-23-like n=1 Tax=Elaeis guineensis var. tenera TaxID=51953 RepID=UPI003C6D0A62
MPLSKQGSVVKLVSQGTNIFAREKHPMHIHGHQFYIHATDPGNFDPKTDTARFKLADPPLRNTVGVPVRGEQSGGVAGALPSEVHITWGLAMAFLVGEWSWRAAVCGAPSS